MSLLVCHSLPTGSHVRWSPPWSLPQTTDSKGSTQQVTRAWLRKTHLLQGVVRGVTEAARAALQPAGLCHGLSLLIQQNLGDRDIEWNTRQGWSTPAQPLLHATPAGCADTVSTQKNEPLQQTGGQVLGSSCCHFPQGPGHAGQRARFYVCFCSFLSFKTGRAKSSLLAPRVNGNSRWENVLKMFTVLLPTLLTVQSGPGGNTWVQRAPGWEQKAARTLASNSTTRK